MNGHSLNVIAGRHCKLHPSKHGPTLMSIGLIFWCGPDRPWFTRTLIFLVWSRRNLNLCSDLFRPNLCLDQIWHLFLVQIWSSLDQQWFGLNTDIYFWFRFGLNVDIYKLRIFNIPSEPKTNLISTATLFFVAMSGMDVFSTSGKYVF